MKRKSKLIRKYPVGAEIVRNEGVNFRVWAPDNKTVEAAFYNQGENQPYKIYKLTETENGYFEAFVPGINSGALYKFRLNGADDYFPDPASRYQPDGPHGASQIIDPDSFNWSDSGFKGIDPENLVIYEMHIGTFTREGTWKAAEEKLEYLADTGINLLEIMPFAEFPGKFGWGYDGVCLYSAYHHYGTPDDCRSFINKAHQLGIGVIHDVVYNHLGPDGNYLGKYSEDYFSRKYKTDWGPAINYDGENSAEVRAFFKTNAAFWLEEYHMDGLRLDATQDIFDESEPHILAEISDIIRKAAGNKKAFVVTENEPQNCILVKEREKGGYGFDAMWNDDFHHSAMVALTGKNEAYYTDYLGKPQEFISALKYGFLYQGQYYKWQKKRRGRISFSLHPRTLVNFIQNHDQIANSGRGLRVHYLTSPGNYRAMTTLFLLGPQTPMLFQGQEFASSSPFLYFADHEPELAKMVHKGRIKFLKQFRSMATREMKSFLADPANEETFRKSKLNHDEVINSKIYKLHKDLISLRVKTTIFRMNQSDGAVLGESAFLIRYFNNEDDYIMIVNFGTDLNLNPAPEPLLAPDEGKQWDIFWSSEHPSYGGGGTPPLENEDNWQIPGHAAVVLYGKKERKNGKNN